MQQEVTAMTKLTMWDEEIFTQQGAPHEADYPNQL